MATKTEPQSYIVEVTDGSGYAHNGLRFPSWESADNWAFDLMCRWLAAQDYRIVESNDAPNYEGK